MLFDQATADFVLWLLSWYLGLFMTLLGLLFVKRFRSFVRPHLPLALVVLVLLVVVGPGLAWTATRTAAEVEKACDTLRDSSWQFILDQGRLSGSPNGEVRGLYERSMEALAAGIEEDAIAYIAQIPRVSDKGEQIRSRLVRGALLYYRGKLKEARDEFQSAQTDASEAKDSIALVAAINNKMVVDTLLGEGAELPSHLPILWRCHRLPG